MHYRWLSGAGTHAGNVRRLNEDAYLNLPERGVWAVADGMGGHSAGEVASQAIVQALGEPFAGSTLHERSAEIEERLQECNRLLYAQARERGVQIIGSTVVVLVSDGIRAACLWAGDSRAYRLRDGRLAQLTEDHSRVQELVANGLISAEAAREHPQGNVVTRAVGAADRLDLAVVEFAVEPRDAFLLCSDGLTGELTDAEIESLAADGDCQRSADALIDATLARPAKDNVSVVVTRLHDDTPTQFGGGRAERADPATDRTIIR